MSQEIDLKENILGGETSVTPSSDEAIRTTLEQLNSEIAGLPRPEVIIEGETLKPVLITDAEPNDDKDKDNIGEVTSPIVNLRPSNSRLGLTIWQKRIQKKAA